MKEYFIQVNDYMTPVKVSLNDEELEGVKKALRAIIEGDKDALVELADRHSNIILDNYNEWFETHKN